MMVNTQRSKQNNIGPEVMPLLKIYKSLVSFAIYYTKGVEINLTFINIRIEL